ADLLHENSFAPDGLDDGPYTVRLSVRDGRLAFDIRSETSEKSAEVEFRYSSLNRWYAIISLSAKAITRPSRPGVARWKPWIWGGAPCITKVPSCCAGCWRARSQWI